MITYQEFYRSIAKPGFAPPEWVFGWAWGIIYPLITIAFIYLCWLVIKEKAPKSLLWVLIANLIANFLFTPVQLGLRPLWPATIVILIILGTLTYFEFKIFKLSKIVFFLLLPYLLWGAFATVLQISITFLNSY